MMYQKNSQEVVFDPAICIHNLFETQAKNHHDATALIFGTERLSYTELNQKANQLARYLKEEGINEGDLVGLYLNKSFELIIAMLAILKAGGAYLPLDLQYPQARLSYMVENSSAAFVLSESTIDRFPVPERVKLLNLDKLAGAIANEPADNLNLSFAADSLAYVMYTSGSTGNPNGVEVVHSGINSLLFGVDYFPYHNRHTFLNLASISFDISTFEIWGALLHGSVCVLYPQRVPDFNLLGKIIAKHNVSCLVMAASLFNLIIDENPNIFLPIRYLLIGGEELSTKHIIIAQEELPDTIFINAYGPTEATTFACCYEIPDLSDKEISIIPIGKPISNTDVYLLDGNLNIVKQGEVGEIFIGGLGLARGYRNNPELSSKKFINYQTAGSKRIRLYSTGDLARLNSEGNLEFIGRTDHQVKIRGFRIELEEIQAVINSFKKVKHSVIVVREDEPDKKEIVAYIVPHDGSVISNEELRLFLLDKLPEYMIPSFFISLPKLPITHNGKLDRSALPIPSKFNLNSIEKPETKTEERIALIWQSVLKLVNIGLNDNFFNLGGNSLQATQLASRIGTAFNCTFALRNVFKFPKLKDMAREIDLILADNSNSGLVLIPKAPLDAVLPLSFTQERMWFIEKLNPSGRAYQAQANIEFYGVLDIVALEKSLNALVERHEILRTTFPEVEGKPCQVIHQYKPFKLNAVSLHNDGIFEDVLHQFINVPFVLDELPLIRWKLVSLAENKYVLMQVEHHFVHDGWSFSILMKEMFDFYKHFSEHAAINLAPLSIQFKDFAYWQRNWMTGLVLEKQLSYWKKRLYNAPHYLSLPLDFPRPEKQTFKGDIIRFDLPAQLSAALNNFSKANEQTLFLTMCAGFGILMNKYSAMEDIVIGSAVANRRWKETEGILGTFVNNVVFRLDFNGDPTVNELLDQLQNLFIEAFDNQDVPFDKVVAAVQPVRDQSFNPIFQSAFAFHDSPMTDVDLPNLKVNIFEAVSNGSSKFDLNIVAIPRFARVQEDIVTKSLSGITVLWEYNVALFKEITMKKMIEHFKNILNQIVENSQNNVSRIRYMSEADCTELVYNFNNTIVDYPQNETIVDLIRQQTNKTPDAVAVRYGRKTLTYTELDYYSNSIANYLVNEKKIKNGELIGLLGNRSETLLVIILGILKSGAAYLPIDPSNPFTRISYMLEDSCIRILFCEDDLKKNFEDEFPKIDLLSFKNTAFLTASYKPIETAVDNTSLAYVIYTSGSTGLPKGVKIPHKGLYNHVKWAQKIYIDEGFSNFPLHSSISFDITITSLFAPIASGGTVVVYGNEDIGTITEKIIEDNLVDVIKLTPAHIQFLPIEKLGKSKIRKVVVGGDEFKVELAKKIFDAFDGKVEVFNSYGPTETVAGCLLHKYDPDFTYQSSLPVGLPVENRQIYILDKMLNPVPFNVEGEIYISGDGISTGYLNDSVKTNEKFIVNPFIKGSVLYKSGDFGRRLYNGQIVFSGRKDGQVKIRGYRIELGEIESVLLEIEEIVACVVTANEDRNKTKKLFAYCVFGENKNLSEEEIKKFLKKKLPEYMIPFRFVKVNSIPLTPNGKIDYKLLPSPNFEELSSTSHYKPAQNEKEVLLTTIWQKILKIEKIGVDSNYFDLGGHSLLAVELMNSINREMNNNLPLSAIFQAPTIRELALFIDEYKFKNIKAVPIQAKGENTPLLCIPPFESIHFFYSISENLGDTYPVYGFETRFQNYEDSSNRTMEQIAEEYVNELLKLNPDGPYLLLGFSISGIIVFEMAKQLHNLGLKDIRLIIIDTISLDVNFKYFNAKNVIIRQFFKSWESIARKLHYYKIRITSEGFSNVLSGKMRNLFHSALNSGQSNSSKAAQIDKNIQMPSEPPEKNIHWKAAVKYYPQRLTVDIDYFKATDRFLSPVEKYFAFRPFVNGKFIMHYTPGDHFSIVKDKGAKKIAQEIKTIISKFSNR